MAARWLCFMAELLYNRGREDLQETAASWS
jgi:hypothetical protein